MDGHWLLSFLESIRKDVPGLLQGAFDDLVQLVRNIVDALEQVVAPPEAIDTGKRHLSIHHTTLLNHASTLKTNLDDFQTVYTGDGSDGYHQAAYQAHLQLGQLTDHLSFAMGAHDSISTNLGDGQFAHNALGSMLGAMVFSSPSLPEGTPLVAGEGVGAGFSMAALVAAMDAVGVTLTGLATAALPYVVVGTVALVVVTALSGDSVQTTTLPIVLTIPQEAQLPKPRPLTPEEEQVVQDILNELQGAGLQANQAWIEYLMRILGLSLTAKEAGAVIRCMMSKGYMPQITNRSTTSKIQIALSKVWNNLGHLTQQDLEGAWKDVHPDRVTYPKGELPSGAQHLGEVTNARQSLDNLQTTLLDALTNPATPENLRKVYQDLYDVCENTKNYINGKIYGSDPPLKWPDPKGNIPFGDDLISKSGCK
ncbi:MAG: hypothetical protein ABI234_00480 [Ktedonobacteraceae bacterium]